jgi:hypothetical protein
MQTASCLGKLRHIWMAASYTNSRLQKATIMSVGLFAQILCKVRRSKIVDII